MPTLACEYPPALTNREWQKKKGLIAKAKPTGIGDKLTDLEKAFAKSPFGKLDPAVLGADTLDPLLMSKKLDSLKASLTGAARTLSVAIAAADTAIARSLPTFASNQSVKKQLELMRTELKRFDTVLKTTYPTALVAAVRVAYKKKLQTNAGYMSLSNAAPVAEATIKTLLAQIKTVETAGTVASVHQTWPGDGPTRKLTTWCKLWDQLILKDYPQLAKAAGYDKKAMVEVFTLPWVQDAGNETNNDVTKKLTAQVQAGTPEDRVVGKFALEYSRSVIEARTFIAAMVKAWSVLGKV